MGVTCERHLFCLFWDGNRLVRISVGTDGRYFFVGDCGSAFVRLTYRADWQAQGRLVLFRLCPTRYKAGWHSSIALAVASWLAARWSDSNGGRLPFQLFGRDGHASLVVLASRHHSGRAAWRLLGTATAWIALSAVSVVVPAGFFVDRLPQKYKLYAVVGIFVVATAVALLDLIIHGTIPEPPPLMSERSHFLSRIFKPIRDCNFRPWLIFNVCWTFSMTLGGRLGRDLFSGGTRHQG